MAEALLKVTIHWRKVSQAEYPLAYARRIVANTFYTNIRKSYRAVEISSAIRDLPEPSYAGVLYTFDDLDQVKWILSRLTPAQRTAVAMRYLFGEDDDSIAQVLKCAPATVRSHISHARRALRRLRVSTSEEGVRGC